MLEDDQKLTASRRLGTLGRRVMRIREELFANAERLGRVLDEIDDLRASLVEYSGSELDCDARAPAPGGREICLNGHRIRLSASSAALFAVLSRNKGEWVSGTELDGCLRKEMGRVTKPATRRMALKRLKEAIKPAKWTIEHLDSRGWRLYDPRGYFPDP
jgi:DNA-binding response OmpR family regulator